MDLSWDKDGPEKISFAQLWQDRLFFGMLLHRVIQWVLETNKKKIINLDSGSSSFFIQTELWHNLKEISTTSNPHSKQVLKLEIHQDLLLAISFVAFCGFFWAKLKKHKQKKQRRVFSDAGTELWHVGGALPPTSCIDRR